MAPFNEKSGHPVLNVARMMYLVFFSVEQFGLDINFILEILVQSLLFESYKFDKC